MGRISSKAAGHISAFLVGVGFYVGVSLVLFLFYCVYCVYGFVGGTALSHCFIIFSTLFILTCMEGKFSGEHSSQVGF